MQLYVFVYSVKNKQFCHTFAALLLSTAYISHVNSECTGLNAVTTYALNTFGDRAFAAAGPRVWNSFPPHLRDADLPYSRFQRSLKTFLFG